MASGTKTPRWIRLFLSASLLFMVVFGIKAVVHPSSTPAVSSQLSAEHQKMRESAAPWLKTEKDLDALMADVRSGSVVAVGVTPTSVLVTTKAGAHYFVIDRLAQVSQILLFKYREGKEAGFPLVILGSAGTSVESALDTTRNLVGIFFPLLLIGGYIAYTRSSARNLFKITPAPDTRFSDVVGAAEAKTALSDLASYLKDGSAYARVGARPPTGVLMVGGPGTGKTRLAQALAGECGVAFIAASGSDFTSKFYGSGVQRVKTLFEMARKNAPCIVFIDEIDGISARSTGTSPGETEGNRIINQMLLELDGFTRNAGVIVIGATNLVNLMDPALLREGRFDRRVHVRLPDVTDRIGIFQLYAKKIVAQPNIDFTPLARLTTGMSPAAIESIVNFAATLAARKDEHIVTAAHIAEAIEVNRMGEVNNSQKALTPHERERIAVHEAGHAIMSTALKSGKVEKVSILPRGPALGVTLVTQNEDKQLHLQSELEARIQVLLAGRNAELLRFGEASSGAAQDLEEASKLAMAMVARFGFGRSGSLFSIGALGDSVQSQPEIAHAIEESRELLHRLNGQCQAHMARLKPALDDVTQQLLAVETVEGRDVERAVASAQARAGRDPS